MSSGTGATTRGVDCAVVERLIYGTLRWFVHMMRIDDDYFVNIIHEGSIGRGVEKGRPPLRCTILVDKHWIEVADWRLRVVKENA